MKEMLKKQAELQKRLGTDFNGLSPKEKTLFIKEHSIHVGQELNEMLYELPYFKPWKDYSGMSYAEIVEGFNKARAEYIDLLHFIFNIGLALDLDADDIHRMYMEKNKENHQRQDEGYTHDKQYR